MKRNVEVVSADQPAEEARARMRARRIRHLVVMRGPEVIGVLSDRDLAENIPGRTVGEAMTPSVVTANKTTTIREAANILRGRTIGCLPILEEERLVGIVTVSDLLTLLGKGSERPASKSKRWILKGRGPRRKRIGR
jgi:acetoin utilization protein AcuB